MLCSCGNPSPKACEAMHHAAIIKETENYTFAKMLRLRVDTYCLQHPDPYLISSKSFLAHLLGMCIAMDYGNDPHLFKVIEKWGFGNNQIPKPPMPNEFGALTIAHILHARDGDEYSRLVQEWAASVWRAYADYHGMAHEWLEKAKKEYYR